MRIYLVRHAESQAFREGIAQSPETALSKHGIIQSKLLSKRLKSSKIEKILSSNWRRAGETAEKIAEENDTEVTYLDFLHEKEQHKLLYGVSNTAIVRQHQEELEKNLYSLDWKFLGEGESFRELLERCNKLRGFLETLNEGNILIVSHKIFLKSFILSCILPEELTEDAFMPIFRNISIDFASLSILEGKHNNSWKVLLLNDTSHLTIKY